MHKIAFIVATFENPLELLCCLASLKLQTFQVDIYVTDNSVNEDKIKEISNICNILKVNYFKTTGDCYTASEQVIDLIDCDWVCFASSDGYYVPGFTSIMYQTALQYNSDLVYCDCVYDPRLHGRGIYSVLHTFPEKRWIDKTCFIVKRRLFRGWPSEVNSWRDGAFIEECVASDYRLNKAKGVLVFHN